MDQSNYTIFSHATMFYRLFLVTVGIFNPILYMLFKLWPFVVFELIWGMCTLVILFLTVSILHSHSTKHWAGLSFECLVWCWGSLSDSRCWLLSADCWIPLSNLFNAVIASIDEMFDEQTNTSLANFQWHCIFVMWKSFKRKFVRDNMILKDERKNKWVWSNK